MINQVVVGDITYAPNDGVIAHQVNCRSKMGAGLAKALCDTFPTLKEQYLSYCSNKTPESLLGEVQVVECVNKYTGLTHSIANVFGQLDYGRDPVRTYTDYQALELAFIELSTYCQKVYMPYGIGAGLANGNWKQIVSIIDECFLANSVTLYKIKDIPVRFGFTEKCDPSINYDWVNNLSTDGNVVISKNLTDTLIAVLLNYQDEIIFHHTVTGFGGLKVEHKVPSKEWSRNQFDKLIERGFPVEQTVLRVDPIIPTDKGINTALSVMKLYADSGVKRVRFSFMDMHPHVKARFNQQGIPLPYDTFHAPGAYMISAINQLSTTSDALGYQLESCAESVLYKKGCLSETDYKLLNVPFESCSKSQQRSNCLCCGSKYELIPRHAKCTLGCLYCYWKD